MRTEHAIGDKDVVRGFAETRHRAGSWRTERRAVARIEATQLGLDIRFIVTNLDRGSPEWLYETLYCARGQAENLILMRRSRSSMLAHCGRGSACDAATTVWRVR